MAIGSSSGSEPAALARRQAQSILIERRFHAGAIPRPLHGILRTAGEALESPLQALDELVAKLGTITPGGPTVVWAILALLILGVSALLATRGARRSLHDRDGAILGATGDHPLSMADLERAALTAERESRHGEAVRLRFRAGLMALAEREPVTPSMLNVEVSRVLHSRRFDELAGRFDEIVYGGRPAVPEDVRASRAQWHELLSGKENQ